MAPPPVEPDDPSGRTPTQPRPAPDDAESEARGGELLRAVEDRDYLLSHVRCFLWRADVRAEEGRLLWRFSYANEEAAWRYFPLRDPGLLPDGTRSFAAALRRSRLPEDRERMRALAWRRFQANQSYTQDYAVLTTPEASHPPEAAGAAGAAPNPAAPPTDEPDPQHIRWLRERVEVRPLAPGRWEAIGVTVDVTDYRLLEEARLAREREVAAARIRAMGEYFSVASHELRTPITSVKAYTQLLLRRLERGDPVDREALIRTLRNVDSQSSRLVRLVDHLLDANRVELGRLRLDAVPTAIDDLVRRVVEETSARAPDTPIRHFFAHPPPIEATVDPLRLEQVLLNLLDNALRHGARRPVDVTLSREADGIRIVVRDRGPGVPPTLREAIFEPYHQIRPDSYVSGLGLGLFVSRQIAELHGGWLRATDPDGQDGQDGQDDQDGQDGQVGSAATESSEAPNGERGISFVVWLPAAPPPAPLSGTT